MSITEHSIKEPKKQLDFYRESCDLKDKYIMKLERDIKIKDKW